MEFSDGNAVIGLAYWWALLQHPPPVNFLPGSLHLSGWASAERRVSNQIQGARHSQRRVWFEIHDGGFMYVWSSLVRARMCFSRFKIWTMCRKATTVVPPRETWNSNSWMINGPRCLCNAKAFLNSDVVMEKSCQMTLPLSTEPPHGRRFHGHGDNDGQDSLQFYPRGIGLDEMGC